MATCTIVLAELGDHVGSVESEVITVLMACTSPFAFIYPLLPKLYGVMSIQLRLLEF